MLPASALRPYIFAKIHGIFSGFRSPDTILSLLQSGSLEKALAGLPVPLTPSGDSDQLSREYRLHQAFFSAIQRLVPARGVAGRFFSALMGEYEARNVATWLKTGGLTPGNHFPLPERTWPLTGMLVRTGYDLGRKILAASSYRAVANRFFEDNDAVSLDRTLEQEWFSQLHGTALKLHPRDRKIILPLLTIFLDIQTTLHAARLRVLYKHSPEESSEALFFHDKDRKKALITGLAEEEDDMSHLFPASCRTGIRDTLATLPTPEQQQGHTALADLEQAASVYLQRLFRKHFYLAHQSLGPLFCFYFLLKSEILNTALLCNSIRFDAGPDLLRRELYR